MRLVEDLHEGESPMLWEKRFFDALNGANVVISREFYSRAVARGVTAAYRFTPPGPLRGRVVFAHATGNDALFPQVGLFSAWLGAGLEVFAFDLDGHGRHSTTSLSWESAPSMIHAAVTHATAGRPPLPLHGAGQSLGAALWLQAMGGASVEPTSLVLFSAPIAVNLGLRALMSELHALHSRPFWRQRPIYGCLGMVPPLGPWKRGTYPVRLLSPPADSAQAPWRQSFSYPQTIAQIIRRLHGEAAGARPEVPALLVYGARDLIVPWAQGESLQRRLSHASLRIIQGATHYTVPFAAEVIQASTEWLTRTHGSRP